MNAKEVPPAERLTIAIGQFFGVHEPDEMESIHRMVRDVLPQAIDKAVKESQKGTITLCGSTRFKAAYINWLQQLTDEGWRVFSVGRFLPKERHGEQLKKDLDCLHLRKIDASEAIFVLDVGGYVGESTRREITHAESTGKTVRYLSKEFPAYVEPELSATDIGQVIARPFHTALAKLVEAGTKFLAMWNAHPDEYGGLPEVDELTDAIDAAKKLIEKGGE